MSNFKIRKSVAHVEKDGTPTAKVVTVVLNDETFMFSANLPDYVVRISGGPCDVDTTISADTAKGIIETYEMACDEYARRLKMRSMPTRLWVGLLPPVSEPIASVFGVSVTCGIGFRRVKTDADGRIFEMRDDGSSGGYLESIRGTGSPPILIDDTPANIAKIESLAGSIRVAAEILADMRNAIDAQQYLMQIQPDFTLTVRSDESQLELPFSPTAVFAHCRAVDDDL